MATTYIWRRQSAGRARGEAGRRPLRRLGALAWAQGGCSACACATRLQASPTGYLAARVAAVWPRAAAVSPTGWYGRGRGRAAPIRTQPLPGTLGLGGVWARHLLRQWRLAGFPAAIAAGVLQGRSLAP